MATINELTWASLTGAVNEIQSPNSFILRLLYGNKDPKSTESIELSTLTGGRDMAPFVRKNGEAVMVGGIGETFATVEPPNIRIKRPMTPSEVLFKRRPGTVIFPSGDEQISAIQQHIARDAQHMADMITNAEEYLAAMTLQGTITYEVADQETFQITFPKPAANTVTLTTFWDDADPTKPTPEIDFLTAKRLVSDAHGLGVTDAIMGVESSAAFLTLAKNQGGLLDNRNIAIGAVTFNEQFRDDGVLYLGTYSGVRCWEYARTVDIDGVATSLIRPKYVEFVAVTPAAETVEYFGALADWKALQGRLFQGQRFSKSWEEEDPSVRQLLITSRPLPTPRRPGFVVSMKVVSG
ncbi:MAG: hypothetical protein GY906_12965 [bacterium]|nr:hypothetical protein [bacterium]